MTRRQARYQALAASGSAVIFFIGLCHEAVGETLFPWGPAFMGGYVIWHGMGVLCILTGLLLLAGSLGLIRFPVRGVGLALVLPAMAIAVAAAVLHGQFHLFALALAAAGAIIAYCHPRSANCEVGEASDAP